MKSVLAMMLAGMFAVTLAGCRAEVEAGDADSNRTTRVERTTTEYPARETEVRREVRIEERR